MRVQEIMTSNPAVCRPDTSLQDVARMMVDMDCGAIPVVEDGGVPVGIVTDRDIVARVVARGENPLTRRATDVMTSPALKVSPDNTVEQLCSLMEKNQVRRVVVVDAGEHCIGMVSQADLALKTSEQRAGATVERISEPSAEASSPSGHNMAHRGARV